YPWSWYLDRESEFFPYAVLPLWTTVWYDLELEPEPEPEPELGYADEWALLLRSVRRH
ncbi:hypothetical protein MMC22_011849, partial [Lobaria immixta]|nr:hypothetical protein [Lobaria immixta]